MAIFTSSSTINASKIAFRPLTPVLRQKSHLRPRWIELTPASHSGLMPSRTSRSSGGNDSSIAHRGHSFFTNRCEIASFRLSATMKGCARNKDNRLGTSQAEFVCKVEMARWPEEDNRIKASTLSSSRISPIITLIYAQIETTLFLDETGILLHQIFKRRASARRLAAASN